HLDGEVPTPRTKPLAIAAEGQAGDKVSMPAQGESFLARLHVPYLDGAVPTRGIEPLIVAAQRQAPDPAGMPAQCEGLLSRFQVPYFDGAVFPVDELASTRRIK